MSVGNLYFLRLRDPDIRDDDELLMKRSHQIYAMRPYLTIRQAAAIARAGIAAENRARADIERRAGK